MADETRSGGTLQIDTVLMDAVKKGASDIHFKPGMRPLYRIKGTLTPVPTKVIDKGGIESILRGLLNDPQKVAFDENGNLDCAIPLEDKASGITYRFRMNAAKSEAGPYVTLRVIPDKIPDIKQLGFPNDSVWGDIITLKRGLVLVTGVTGSGKTTTLAALIQEINKTRGENIITLEDPIEYVYKPDKSVISQREVGKHLRSFADGIKYAMRQDPNIILVGEVRDKETARHALEATETGHLVLATVHTKDTSQTASRYIELFPKEEQESVSGALANNLAYVLSQQLMRSNRGEGKRVLAMEVLNVKDHAGVRKHIRDKEYHQIYSDIQTGKKSGMIPMDGHIKELIKEGKITAEDALPYAHYRDNLRKELGLQSE